MNITSVRNSFQLKNLLKINFNLPKTVVKCFSSEAKNSTEKHPEVPKLENLKEKNPFFSKYEAKLKTAYK